MLLCYVYLIYCKAIGDILQLLPYITTIIIKIIIIMMPFFIDVIFNSQIGRTEHSNDQKKTPDTSKLPLFTLT